MHKADNAYGRAQTVALQVIATLPFQTFPLARVFSWKKHSVCCFWRNRKSAVSCQVHLVITVVVPWRPREILAPCVKTVVPLCSRMSPYPSSRSLESFPLVKSTNHWWLRLIVAAKCARTQSSLGQSVAALLLKIIASFVQERKFQKHPGIEMSTNFPPFERESRPRARMLSRIYNIKFHHRVNCASWDNKTTISVVVVMVSFRTLAPIRSADRRQWHGFLESAPWFRSL